MSNNDHWLLTLPSRKVTNYAFITRRTLNSVRLAAKAHQLDALVEDASANTLSYFDFLDTLVKQEWESKEALDLQKRIQKARFPYSKSIHDFDFKFQPSISEQRVKETCVVLLRMAKIEFF